MEHLQHKAAWFPAARRRIGGRSLGAPTLGQLRLLEAVESPFVSGGQADALDCAIALRLLATPWRRSRKALAGASQWRWQLGLWSLRRTARRLRRRGQADTTALALAALVEEVLWSPEAYSGAGNAAAAARFAACGLALRLAHRAAELRLVELSPEPRRSVWDLPVAEVMTGSTVGAEREGREFVTREELAQFSAPAASTCVPALRAGTDTPQETPPCASSPA